MLKKSLGKIAVVFGLFTTLLLWGGVLLVSGQASAQTDQTKVTISISSALSLSVLDASNAQITTTNLPITPSSSGSLTSRRHTVIVSTNAPGYHLGVQTSSSNLTNTTLAPNPTIPSTTGTIANPIILSPNTWGFAVPKNQTGYSNTVPGIGTVNSSSTGFTSSVSGSGFNNTYSEESNSSTSSAKYASLPTAITAIKDTTTATNGDGTTFFYASNVDITKPAGQYGATITYTVVGEAVPDPILPMQTFTAANCSAMTVGDITTRVDTRNNQNYRIRKMEDNKCWMIDNLRLELTDSTVLTPADSNVSVDTPVTLAKSNSATWNGNFQTDKYMTADGTNTTTAPNQDVWSQANPGTASDQSYCAPGADLTTCYGYLYNGYTATAGTAPQTQILGVASGSICPANWRLPTGYNSADQTQNDFGMLNGYMAGDNAPAPNSSTESKYHSNWLPSGAFAGAFSGRLSNGFNGQGTTGSWWSSSVATTTDNSRITLHWSGILMYGHEPRYNGDAVRCLLD